MPRALQWFKCPQLELKTACQLFFFVVDIFGWSFRVVCVKGRLLKLVSRVNAPRSSRY